MMNEKEVLLSLIEGLGKDEIAALKRIVSSMVTPAYMEEVTLNAAVHQVESGYVSRGGNVDELFK